MEMCAKAVLEPRQCFKLEEQAPNFCLHAYDCGKEIEVCQKGESATIPYIHVK